MTLGNWPGRAAELILNPFRGRFFRDVHGYVCSAYYQLGWRGRCGRRGLYVHLYTTVLVMCGPFHIFTFGVQLMRNGKMQRYGILCVVSEEFQSDARMWLQIIRILQIGTPTPPRVMHIFVLYTARSVSVFLHCPPHRLNVQCVIFY